MEDLKKWKDSPLWDDEASNNDYAYPLALQANVALIEGKRLAVGIPDEEVYRRGPFVCAKSPSSHIGPFKWATDFLVPDGTPVYSAREGVTIEIHQDSETWGDGPKFQDKLNYMTIEHDNGEYTQYCHLAKRSVWDSGLSLGACIRRGRQIAVVGKTGWTDRDHLHFIVFRIAQNESPFGFKSLQPRFI